MGAGTVFLSEAVGAARLLAPGSAGADPGWTALCAAYADSLATCGWNVRPVLRPEIYGTPQARAVLDVRPGDWHLAVKPVEHLRPFPGIGNAFVCDWPFPELSSATLGGSPFFDQLRVLRSANAVLCTNGFTTDTLRRAGVERAVTLPPHLPPRPQAEGDRSGFLCVVDANSLLRQLGPTLDGFAAALAVRPGLRLTLRLRGGGEADRAALRRQAAADGCGDAVSVVGDENEDRDVAPPGARFFLSAHAAPGLHLPLAEAVAAGIVPVATLVAGTASFLPPGAVIPVETRPDTLDGDGEPVGRFLPLTSHRPTADTVRNAVLEAAALDEAGWQRMAQAGRAAAARFGLPAFREGLAGLAALLPGARA